MGVVVNCFGLCVILILLLQPKIEVNGVPVPQWCCYHHGYYSQGDATASTTAVPSTDKPKDDVKEKLQQFAKLLQELLAIQNEDKKKEDEEKKKAEEDKKKAEAQTPKGFTSVDEFMGTYWQFFSTFYNSF